MIYTLTFNPALDYIMRLPVLREGETNRAASTALQFGGKGINVSLVLAEMGVESVALGFVAGFTGEALSAHLAAVGVQTDFIPLPEGLTRINVKLKTPEGDHPETEINAAGPAIPTECLEALYRKLDALSAEDTLVLAGSIPPSLPRDTYCRILARLSGRGIRFVVDAEGALLTETLPYSPFLIKPNRTELEGIAGRPLSTEAELRSAAAHLQEQGARNVLVSLGGDGAILLDENGHFHSAAALPVTAVNTVGAGDSAVAGFLAGAEQGYGYALMMAMVCGAATAAGEGLATGADIERLMKEIEE